MFAEAISLSLLLFGALLCLMIRKTPRWTRAASVLAAAVMAAALVTTMLALRAPRRAENDITDRPRRVVGDGYVSSSTCHTCHPSNHATWSASWHRTMTQVASPDAILGDFDGVEVSAYGRRYLLERRGDQFWVEMDAPDATRVWRRIVMTTGSHHVQDYWFETGQTRKVGFLPLMYLIRDRRWVPFGAGFLEPPTSALPSADELDRWQTTCIKCHVTHGKPRTILPDDQRDMDTTVAEFGIACEACHGPAAEHVRVNRDPLRRYAQRFASSPDPTIVNPARLDATRSSQVCGRCHGIHRPPEVLPRASRLPNDWRDHGISYRPGDDLEAHRYLVRSSKVGERRFEEIRLFDPHLLEDRFWADGMVRVSGREYNALIESPCFARGVGDRKLSCSSCHRMHQARDDPRSLEEWADDQLDVGMDGNGACLQCHEQLAGEQALAAHSHHEPSSTGSLCANCHMPYTTYGLLKAIRSHTIDSPDLRVPRDTGRPLACNLCHLDRGMGWTRRHLQNWYDAPRIELPLAVAAVPSSIMWMLSGDAGQRALSAWAMGWEPAIQASSKLGSWMVPFLAQLLVDPYDAVRYIAGHSLRRYPGFENFDFDYVAPLAEREIAASMVTERWYELQRETGVIPDLEALVDDPLGQLPPGVYEILYRQRNDRRVSLAE